MRVALYGTSANPPCRHHIRIAEELTKYFDKVIVIPCGIRPDKESANILPLHHRKALAEAAFGKLARIEIDYHDLENNSYTPTYYLQERYVEKFPGAELWHAVGTDIIVGGGAGNSEIHRIWNHGTLIWGKLNWAVVYRPGCEVTEKDMPPHSLGPIVIRNLVGSGTMVRQRIAKGEPISYLVIPEVETYIKKFDLYKKQKS